MTLMPGQVLHLEKMEEPQAVQMEWEPEEPICLQAWLMLLSFSILSGYPSSI